MPTLNELKSRLLTQLTDAEIEPTEARAEADIIVEHATGWSVADQILKSDETLANEPQRVIESIIAQRRKRVPLQYCLGYAWFMGLKFAVRPGVFIPRVDTELLVALTLKRLDVLSGAHVAEIGSGSGAIGVSLLALKEDLTLTALERSSSAVAVTRENAERFGVEDRITIVQRDWFRALPRDLDGIVSNPPYIPLTVKPTLAPEVAQYEPPEALFGAGEDGLGFYRSFAEAGGSYLKSDGFVVLEFGDGQAEAVERIFTERGWREVEIHADLNGLPRALTALRPAQGLETS